ncbi:hypothetical protein CEUSTIGMA_g1924.t1 [Chlamydomonas eustigma]|uniref:GATA-type domain-containing protein n=1 Tax=Chlamydomonas eustigma TaxID=1157962 RepID=A0A250WUK0_9CHLO|nr:hypothetical protein CEUSTIGMA_g1924.t1 [Chlamydomonas eustigma]|eukprot:GAX74475.1 hypothetical protein CEUSTIGMA_g1924.t1 [Chlamydomonas eustigma]
MRAAIGGPCNHCGRYETPCWRRGPPDKPCLCNACGARWLVKQSLDGYMPGPPRSKKRNSSADHLGVSSSLGPLYGLKADKKLKRGHLSESDNLYTDQLQGALLHQYERSMHQTMNSETRTKDGHHIQLMCFFNHQYSDSCFQQGFPCLVPAPTSAETVTNQTSPASETDPMASPVPTSTPPATAGRRPRKQARPMISS